MVEKVTPAKIIYDTETDKYRLELNAPISVCWTVSRSCNLSCKYCLSSSGPKGDKGLSTEKNLEIIDKMAGLNITRLDFSGGEPFLRDDIFILIKHAVKKGIHTAISTNATLLDDTMIGKLKDLPVIVQTSIDGPKEVHNHQRGADVFDQTITNIKKLVEAGCRVRINTFLYQDNLQYIDYLLDLSQQLKVFSHLFLSFVPSGRARNKTDKMLSQKQIEKTIDKLQKYKKASGRLIKLHLCRPDGYLVTLQPNGDLVALSSSEENDVVVGNVFSTKLDVLFKNPAFNHFSHVKHFLQKYDE